jgi:hypothetical protein
LDAVEVLPVILTSTTLAGTVPVRLILKLSSQIWVFESLLKRKCPALNAMEGSLKEKMKQREAK